MRNAILDNLGFQIQARKIINMASTVGKTPTKQANEIKKEHEGRDNKGRDQEKEKNSQDRQNNKHDSREQRHGDRGPRESRFDRGRGRGRGGFGQRGGRGGGMQFKSEGNFQSNPPDFTGEIQNEEPKEPKKFTGRCRLFVGNITPDTTEEQFKEMFTPYGEVSEVFVNAARGFGFIRLDYRINAEKAKLELDGQVRNNRVLRVRFATHGAALKVTNLSPFVSNELLDQAFSEFGEVERAVVCVDDRGRSYGEGIVEFARKPGASAAQKRINDGVFLLTSFPRPVRVEPLEQKDEEDGLTEKFVQKNEGYRKDREKEPRFAPPGSFEFEFGMKHRRIDDMEKERIEQVKRDMDLERTRLAEEMETAIFDYQADQIRQDLMRQQEELKRLEEMKNEQMRRRQEMDMRRQEQQMRADGSIMRIEEERRREMMMRASNTMNRDLNRDMNREMSREMSREGGMPPQGPGGPRGPPPANRPEEMMRGGPPPGMRDERGNQRSSGPGTPPMPPPPVPPGMNMEQGNMDNRFPPNMQERSPANGPERSPVDDRERGIKQEQLQRQGPQGNRFQGPPGPGNFPPNMGNMGGPPGNLFPKMQSGMGNNMGGDRRREGGPRREDFENKRMRRY